MTRYGLPVFFVSIGGLIRHRASVLAFLTGLSLVTTIQTSLAAAPGPYLAGLRRLTESQYRNSISDIFGPDILVQGKFEPDQRVGGLLAASSSTFRSRRRDLKAMPRLPTASPGRWWTRSIGRSYWPARRNPPPPLTAAAPARFSKRLACSCSAARSLRRS